MGGFSASKAKMAWLVAMTTFVFAAWSSTAYATDRQLEDAYNEYGPKVVADSNAYIQALSAWRDSSDTDAVLRAAKKWRKTFRNFRKKIQSADPPFSANGSKARRLFLQSLNKYDKMTELLVDAARFLYSGNTEAFAAKMDKASAVSKVAGVLLVRAQRALRQ